ncbi:nucleotide sugar dehydrogenase [Bosea sp. (in: a-proteobacteria)]|uniref:nucleotide sugar dehydrogenase n=1 Tax=Bosea sp. (in: a-proteobacteria) TaxID=1871050 RepID=UPI0012177AF4|nr:nucleotide sugar dehydrogenase [Bosea sp. (in: a-proteobacteria)]TAJ32723.1 MAG: nucleotide sugar dehydrogenase [Bosea sp. (in: a-proteobacteria)]
MSSTLPGSSTVSDEALAAQLKRVADKSYRIGIIGLGYVGIPLALTACKAGFSVVGFDIDAKRVEQINRGESFIKHIPTEAIAAALKQNRFRATTDFDQLNDVDAIIIAVPTPLTKHREPDLSYVEATARVIAPRLRKGHLVVLESTTWPGTTDEIMRPIFEKTGLKSGVDFYLAFSPEREDPGNPDFGTSTIPKVVGGDGADALELANAVYSGLVVKTVPVSSSATAEAVKLTENIFRAVNIALVNELKVIYGKMGIDVWEVIDAAKTKPFGFMPFYPGPGLGGHCIPIDPFYLTWKAREFDVTTRFIELAGQINTAMPHWVVDRVAEALDRRQGRGLNNAKILVMGVAYKKNIDDMRESPSLRLIELLEERGAKADYHDPHIPVIPPTREHANLTGRASVPLSADVLAGYDAVLIATDHDAVDYKALVTSARLVVDTRNACAKAGLTGENIVKA